MLETNLNEAITFVDAIGWDSKWAPDVQFYFRYENKLGPRIAYNNRNARWMHISKLSV